MDIIQIIEEIEDLIDDAASVPFSKKVMIDADKIHVYLDEIKTNLPEEVKQAQWINEEKERILAEAKREADSIKSEAQIEADKVMQDAKKRFEALINDHDITRQAEEYGEQIVRKAEQNAKTLQMQSITYVDEMLGTTQDKLKEILNVLEENRNELRDN
ncbi:MAG: ATPase [Tissierellia bacterium]|nr:ATPase [Tissierellia bacterium]